EAAVTNAAKAKSTAAKKKTAVRKTRPPEFRSVPLVPGPATVSVSANSRVTVRGRAGLIGEKIAVMTNGEPVNVIEEVTLKHSKPDEPSVWAKIVLPPDLAHPWVSSQFIDANKTVKAKKLNLRAGPGENYSIIGALQKGDAVETLETKGEWTEIQTPTNAFAFIAAAYLKQETPLVAAVPAEPATVPENTMAIPPAATPTMPETPAMTN